MEDFTLLIDLHRHGERQGPGGDDETRLAITLAGLHAREDLRVADIGCGTGASSLILAEELDAVVTAVDFLPEFLADLEEGANEAGLLDRIEPLSDPMDALPFADGALDAIWSEGAIYNIGFENGVKSWRRFLKPGGVLAVSEITWLTNDRPAELQDHWDAEYPEIATAAEKMAVLEANGYSPIGYFPLPVHCWLENYYRPMQARFDEFLARNANSEEAQEIVAAEKHEIALYERFSAYVSYGFYIAKKVQD